MRVSSNQSFSDGQFFLQRRQQDLHQQSSKIASQSRIVNLRDDPLAAARSTRYQSQISRLNRFSQNIDVVRGRLSVTEGYLSEAVSVFQRVRELAIQGASGTIGKEQSMMLGEEVDQLLRELVAIGNARGEDGKSLFAGYNNSFSPFTVEIARLNNGREGIRSVNYVGDIGRSVASISDKSAIDFTTPGNYAFWAENQQIFSTLDATSYRATADGEFRLDGISINIKQGDNVFSIIDKINSSEAPVRARLDPIRDSIVLETTFPHQLWPEDIVGTVLSDLGVLEYPSEGNRVSSDLASSARVFGGSAFEMVILVRDNLFVGDLEQVGSAGIRGIDQALDNVISTLAEVGSKANRINLAQERILFELPERIATNDLQVGLDLAEAITDLKSLETAHQAALQATARSLSPSLMEFLR